MYRQGSPSTFFTEIFGFLQNMNIWNGYGQFSGRNLIMDFTTIGSVSNYVNNMKLENKWKQKKAEGNFKSKANMTALEMKNASFKEYYKRTAEEHEDDKLKETIDSKIAVDAELTQEEMEYLRETNPTLYNKIKSIEKEKKSYEKELKSCKTKEEVDRLKLNKVNQSLSVIKSAESDPNIPQPAKLAIAAGEMRRMNALNKISAKFYKTGGYDRLPTEEEVNEVKKELKEAEQAEKDELYENIESAVPENNDDTADAGKTDINEEIENMSDASDTVSKEEKDVLDVELSPDAQKIKRSKAKKAYMETETNFEKQYAEISLANKLNISDDFLK